MTLKYCTNCGGSIDKPQKFCGNCGEKLEVIDHSEGKKDRNDESMLQKFIKILMVYFKKGLVYLRSLEREPKQFLVIVAITVLVLFVLFKMADSPSNAVEKLISYSENEQWEKGEKLIAEEMLTFTEEMGNPESIRLGMEELVYYDDGLMKDFSILSEDVADKEGVIYALIDYDNGNSVEWQFNIVHENGDWKVLTFTPE